MALPFKDAIDLALFELRNAVVQNLAGAPATAKAGLMYFDTAKAGLYINNGTAWRPTDAALLSDGSILNTALATNPLLRSNHSGTQLSSTISDFSSAVKQVSLDQMTGPAGPVSMNSQPLNNLGLSTAASSAVRYDQVNQLIAQAVAGQTAIKNPVRLLASTNLSLSGAATIDSVTANNGDRVAAVNQTTGSQNGIYIVNTSGAWSLATDANSNTSWVEGTEFLVAEGTQYGGSIFRQTTSGAITIGTTTLTFVQTAKINTYTADGSTLSLTGQQFSVRYGAGAGITTNANGLAEDNTVFARKYSQTITGDGNTTSFNINHNFAMSDVIVQVKDSSGNVDFTDINTANVNYATVSFGSAPPNGTTYRVTALG